MSERNIISECMFLAVPIHAEVYIKEISLLSKGSCKIRDVATYPSIVGIVNGRAASANALCFIDKQPSTTALSMLIGAVVITTQELASCMEKSFVITTGDPRAVFIDLMKALALVPGFLPLSSLSGDLPAIHPSASIHPAAHIEKGVFIGADTVIASGCVIKSGTWIGERVIVRENTVIGSDGIALYKTRDGRTMRFPHLAGVHIGNDTEIGAGCVLSRGAMSSSVIGHSTVIGNLCNIGHGIQIGERVWMSVGTLVGGNTTIGAGATIGMGACVRDNIYIGEKASIGMGSVVMKDVPAGASLFGNPAKRLPSVDAGPER